MEENKEQYQIVKKEVKAVKKQLKCTKCEEGFMVTTGVVLTSQPPQYEHKCNKCDNVVQVQGAAFPVIDYEEI